MSGSNPDQLGEKPGQSYFVRFRGRIAGPLRRAEVVEQLRAGRISSLHEISVDQVEWILVKDSEEFVPRVPIRRPPAAPTPPTVEKSVAATAAAPSQEGQPVPERPASAGLPPAAAAGASLPGRVTCPNCGQSEWTSDRGCIFWGLVVLFFPIGLLLMLIVPTWTCTTCRYTYRSHSVPTSTKGSGGSTMSAFAILGIGFVGFVILIVVLALLANK